ncbi:c-type cytochrome [Thalassotalea ganghwensis]
MKKVIYSFIIGLSALAHANAFAGDAEAGKAKAAACAACHGADGIGVADIYPNLRGQHADYIAKQLKAFQDGARKNPMMSPMATGLSAEDMANLGAYYESLGKQSSASEGGASAPTVSAAPAYVANPTAGKTLYQNGDQARGITACIACHGEDGNSDVLINPNLSNQHAEYIEKQLHAFKDGSRDNAAMNQVAGQLTTEDIANLGAYFKDTDAVGEISEANAVVTVVKSFTGDIEAGKAKAATCAACHGSDGNAAVAMYPSLAGQSEKYLLKQLMDFKKAVETDNKEGRANAVMAGMVAPLSQDDMKNLAAYYASQTPRASGTETDPVGEKLYQIGDAKRGITACAGCHSIDGKGMDAAGFPALAGQNADYIKAQLASFAKGERANDHNGMMQNIAIKLKAEDIDALATYISSMK